MQNCVGEAGAALSCQLSVVPRSRELSLSRPLVWCSVPRSQSSIPPPYAKRPLQGPELAMPPAPESPWGPDGSPWSAEGSSLSPQEAASNISHTLHARGLPMTPGEVLLLRCCLSPIHAPCSDTQHSRLPGPGE